MTASLTERSGAVADHASPRHHIDLSIVLLTAVATAFGIAMIYSATKGLDATPDRSFVVRQTIFVALGVVVGVVVASVDYRRFAGWAIPGYLAAIGVLLAVLMLGEERKGTQAWFDLGPLQFQPSEPAKLAFIVIVAWFLDRNGDRLDLPRLLMVPVLGLAPAGLILLQPDLGTVLIFVVTALGMLLVAGARGRDLAVLIVLGLVMIVAVLSSDVLAQYQRDRLATFVGLTEVSEGATWNRDRSVIAVVEGGLWGDGWGRGAQTQNGIVPEQQTDFIFTAVAEELGFVGSAVLLTVFLVLSLRIVRTARMAQDRFGALLCAGVLIAFVFQVFQNIGMSMGMMPITGIPLPFVSYGGSSILTWFAAFGIVLNVHMRRFV